MNLYIVTGASRGLGKALCEAIRRFPENELVEISRQAAKTSSGVFIEMDLSDPAAVEKGCDRLDAHVAGKRYDKAVLINNAGVVEPVAPLEDVSAEALQHNLAVNLVAPLLLMRRFLNAFDGVAALRRVINISSGAGRRPIAGWTGYCAAKAGLDMASRVVALEAQSRGLPVEVVSLAPGVIDTDMQATVRSATPQAFPDVDRFRRMKAEGQLRTASDVAADILRAEAEGRLVGDVVLDLRSLFPE